MLDYKQKLCPFLLKNVDAQTLSKYQNKPRITIYHGKQKTCLYNDLFIENLRNLVNSCFPNSELFFQEIIKDFDFHNLYYKIIDNQIVSAFFLIYKDIHWYNKTIKIPYIVAASTNEKYRCQGIFNSLLTEYLYTSSDPFCLLSPDIYSFYEKWGFETILYYKKNILTTKLNLSDIHDIHNNLTKNKDIYPLINYVKKNQFWQNLNEKYEGDSSNYHIGEEEYGGDCLDYHNGIPYIMGRIVNKQAFCDLTSTNNFLDFFQNASFIFWERY